MTRECLILRVILSHVETLRMRVHAKLILWRGLIILKYRTHTCPLTSLILYRVVSRIDCLFLDTLTATLPSSNINPWPEIDPRPVGYTLLFWKEQLLLIIWEKIKKKERKRKITSYRNEIWFFLFHCVLLWYIMIEFMIIFYPFYLYFAINIKS